MNKYNATFIGREVNAIGSFYRIYTTVEAESEHDANIRLYDRYDHISQLVLTEIKTNND